MIACFSQLSVNLKPFDLSAPLGSQGVTDCPAMVTNEATFSGNGFVQILDAFSPGVAFTVSLWFRTAVCDGILFYLANLDPSATDYTSLELIAGVVSSPYTYITYAHTVNNELYMYICYSTVDWATGMCTECLLMQVLADVNAMRGQEIATSCLTSTVQCPYSLYK